METGITYNLYLCGSKHTLCANITKPLQTINIII